MILQNQTDHVEKEHVSLNNTSAAIVESIGVSGVSNSSLEQLSPVQLLKATISFRLLIESDGQQLKKSGQLWACRCPFHPDRTPSFFVDESDSTGRCYGCGWHGDIFNYVMDRTGCSFGVAYHHLLQAPTLHDTKTKRLPHIPKQHEVEYRFSAAELKEIEHSTSRICNEPLLAAKIAEVRKWKPETIHSLAAARHLGWGGDALSFIYKTGIKVRKWPGRDFYWWAGQSHLWRADVLSAASTVYLTEGEPDAITLIDLGLEKHNGVAVVAAPSASTFNDSWAELFKSKDVVLCFDADDAGRQGAGRVGSQLAPVANSVSEWNPKEVA